MSSAPQMLQLAQLSAELNSVLPATPEQAFEVWTQAEHLNRWWGRFEGYKPLKITSDPRVGGEYEIHMLAPDGREYRIFGEYLRVEPPGFLSFTWRFQRIAADGVASDVGFLESHVELSFSPHPAGTAVFLRHSALPSAKECAGVSEGWAGVLQLLTLYTSQQTELSSNTELKSLPNPATRTLRVDARVSASPETLFEWLSKAERLVQWFPRQADTDPCHGGHYRFEWDGTEMGRHVKKGHFVACAPDKMLAYDWYPWGWTPEGAARGPEPESVQTQVRWTLFPQPDQSTLVVLEHSGWAYSEELNRLFAGHAEGWQLYVSNLKSRIEGGPDLRDTAC